MTTVFACAHDLSDLELFLSACFPSWLWCAEQSRWLIHKQQEPLAQISQELRGSQSQDVCFLPCVLPSHTLCFHFLHVTWSSPFVHEGRDFQACLALLTPCTIQDSFVKLCNPSCLQFYLLECIPNSFFFCRYSVLKINPSRPDEVARQIRHLSYQPDDSSSLPRTCGRRRKSTPRVILRVPCALCGTKIPPT